MWQPVVYGAFAIMNPLVLPSSGPPQDAGRAPRLDVYEVARGLGADILNPAPMGVAGKLLGRWLRLDVAQAVAAARRPRSAYLSLSERIGIPLSAIDRHTPHVAVLHMIDSVPKQALGRASGLLSGRVDLAVFSRNQGHLLRTELGVPAAHVHFVPHTVDETFFRPREEDIEGDYILAVGRERRDWTSLAAAARETGLRTVAVAGSPWSHRPGPPGHENLEFRSGLSFEELRGLYAGALVVVVPLQARVTYAAGLTSLREALAVGRPVIVTRTPGLAGEIRHGIDALEVEAEDAGDLADALRTLVTDRQLASQLAAEARRGSVERRTFDRYVGALCDLVRRSA